MAKVEAHEVYGWAARDRSGVLSPIKFSRRGLRSSDVRFKVLYCGVCHTDLHNIKDEWGTSIYPVVPGHEIAGEVTELGSEVKNFKIGDKVGVGYFAGSCRSCEACNGDLENYCPQLIPTCNGKDFDGTVTYGGYSDQMVVDEHYAVRIPDNFPLEAAAPLLCAGITVYSPLRYYGMDQAGKHIGVVGLGGLGHIAVKFAKPFGAEVTVISSSPHKKEESLNLLGADSFLAAAGTFDGIIDTVSAAHPVGPLFYLVKLNSKLVMVEVPEKPLEVATYHLIVGRKTFAGSATGGMKETQEMIDFAAKHGIKPEIEVIPMDEKVGERKIFYQNRIIYNEIFKK